MNDIMWSNYPVSIPRILIVGSGPSAFAAAEMLKSKGFNFEIYDAGLNYARSTVSKEEKPIGTVRKSIFGFNFPYAEFTKGPTINLGNTMVGQSFALGGFSNVWGATMLPYTNQDLNSWPIGTADLQEYYDFISARIPIAADMDSLMKIYPLPKVRVPGLNISRRFEELLVNFQEDNGSSFMGRSRLAVQNSPGGKACIYCGQCIVGCDFGLIWNANSYWYSPNIVKSYFSDRRVIRFKKVGNLNYVEYLDSSGTIYTEGPFDMIFLGASPIETFRILNQSGLKHRQTILLDSQILFAPIFIGKRKIKSQEHTLSHLFLRIQSENMHPINIQLYEYSKDIIFRARKIMPILNLVPQKILEIILSNFIFSLIYLDSRDSSQIEVNFSESGEINLRAILNPKSNVKIALKSMGQWCRANNLYFSRFFAKMGKPGEGVHYGGTLPFGNDVTRDGEVADFSKLYIIDSSTFSSIPAGPITFTIMANSARIVDLATK